MSVDRYISLCWEKVQLRHSTNREYLYVTEVPALIDELLDFVGQPSLITKDERQLLQKIIRSKPLLRIRKHDVPQFMTRLVGISSLSELLRKRAHTTEYELSRLVEAYPTLSQRRTNMFDGVFDDKGGLNVLSSDLGLSRPKSEQVRNTNYVKPQFRDDTEYSKRRDIFADDVRATRRRWGLSDNAKPEIKKEDHLEYSSAPKYKLPGEMDFPKTAIAEEDSTSTATKFWRNLHREDDTLFGRLWPKRTLADIPALVDRSDRLRKRVEELEALCRQYERKIADLESTRESGVIRELRRELEQQELKLHLLEIERDIARGTMSGKVLFSRMPIVREILVYFFHQEERLGRWKTSLSFMAMILAFVLICNTLKFAYYVTLSIAGLMASPIDSENEGIRFSFWEHWLWLEYNYYQLLEWLGY